jgi:membrane fusion protein (multidrug efflux system)
MKKTIFIIAFLAAVAGLAWLVWFKPAKPEEAEKKPDTEVPVHVGKIKRVTLRGYVTAYGTVEAEPAGERPAASARVAPSVPGVVTEVKCVEGQRVEKGVVLFQLDSRAADVAAAFTEKSLERQKKLVQVDGTSQKAFQEAEQQLAAARAQQALLRVQAPLAGTVVRVNVRPGEAVDLTTTLAEVVDLDRLVVSAQVPSSELAALKAAQPAEVLADKSGPPVLGTVSYISSEVDPKTGTALVRAGVPANSGLRPGQFVTLRIVSEEHKDRLAVPVESVVKDAEGGTVIALVQGDKAAQKAVKAGLREGGLIEVEADGLQADMTVVTEGAYGLPKETKIRVLAEGH